MARPRTGPGNLEADGAGVHRQSAPTTIGKGGHGGTLGGYDARDAGNVGIDKSVPRKCSVVEMTRMQTMPECANTCTDIN